MNIVFQFNSELFEKCLPKQREQLGAGITLFDLDLLLERCVTLLESAPAQSSECNFCCTFPLVLP